jgi:hypothetical protein
VAFDLVFFLTVIVSSGIVSERGSLVVVSFSFLLLVHCGILLCDSPLVCDLLRFLGSLLFDLLLVVVVDLLLSLGGSLLFDFLLLVVVVDLLLSLGGSVLFDLLLLVVVVDLLLSLGGSLLFDFLLLLVVVDLLLSLGGSLFFDFLLLVVVVVV